jgi:hypothetical protein
MGLYGEKPKNNRFSLAGPLKPKKFCIIINKRLGTFHLTVFNKDYMLGNPYFYARIKVARGQLRWV